MSKLQAIYDERQHCTVVQEAKGKSVSADACFAAGGKGDELSPAELVGAGLASCMLFTMGMVALKTGLDISGTIVDIDVSMNDNPVARIGGIGLLFIMPKPFTPTDRMKLERATGLCPIKPSLHPDIEIRADFSYPEASGEIHKKVAAESL